MKLLVAKPHTLRNQSIPFEATNLAPVGQLPANDVPWGLIIGGTVAVGAVVGILFFYGRN